MSGWVHRSSSLSGLVIGVLSVSWSSELLLNSSALHAEHIHSTTDEDHFKSTDTNTLAQCYWSTLHPPYILHGIINCYNVDVCVCMDVDVMHCFIWFH